MILWQRMPLLEFLGLAALGVIGLIACVLLRGATPIPQPPNASAFIVIGLTLSGLLLVPASIYVAALGAMFPSFDPATPVTLIGRWPRQIFRLVMVTLGFGIAAAGVDAFGVAVGPLATLVFLVLVLAGLIDAVRLLDASLLIIDPDRLGQMLANRALHPMTIGPFGKPSTLEVNQAFDDLARLARELARKGRPTAAAHAVDRLSEMYSVFSGVLSDRAVERATKITDDLADKHVDLKVAVAGYRQAAGSTAHQKGKSEPEA